MILKAPCRKTLFSTFNASRSFFRRVWYVKIQLEDFSSVTIYERIFVYLLKYPQMMNLYVRVRVETYFGVKVIIYYTKCFQLFESSPD